MAAAIVPLALSALPEIVSLIVGLVHREAPAAQQQLGPKTGPVKFALVYSSVMDALNKAAAAGQISKTLPTDEEVKLIINSVVASMDLSGTLDTGVVAPAAAVPAKVSAPAPQTITWGAGQSVTITVK